MPKKYTLEEAKEVVRGVFGDLYGFEKFTEYQGNKIRFPLICKKHGVFYAKLNSIVSEHCGCPHCAGKNKTTEQFINEAIEIHGNKYDYSLVEYKGPKVKVRIKCNTCDTIFEQRPNDHLSGYGCRKCGYERVKEQLRLTNDEFISKANIVHNFKYDYHLIDCKGKDSLLKIICPEHGMFDQRQGDHLQGKGCPHCNQSSLENTIKVLLEKNNVKFIYQASSRHLPWLSLQSLDFYLPDYNIAIECQGGQHFKEVEYWGGKQVFENIKERDQRKLQKCIENGVKLFYYTDLHLKEYPYKVYENKEELLNEILKNKPVLR